MVGPALSGGGYVGIETKTEMKETVKASVVSEDHGRFKTVVKHTTR